MQFIFEGRCHKLQGVPRCMSKITPLFSAASCGKNSLIVALVQFCMGSMRPQFLLRLRLWHLWLPLHLQHWQLLAAWGPCRRNFSDGYGCCTCGYGQCQFAEMRLQPHEKKTHAVEHQHKGYVDVSWNPNRSISEPSKRPRLLTVIYWITPSPPMLDQSSMGRSSMVGTADLVKQNGATAASQQW